MKREINDTLQNLKLRLLEPYSATNDIEEWQRISEPEIIARENLL